MQIIQHAQRLALSFMYPALCASCDKRIGEDAIFCETCALGIDAIGTACDRCGLPLAGARGLCLACQNRPPPWVSARSPYIFGGPLAEAIRRCKYTDEPEVARMLGRLLPSAPFDTVDVVVPVPLHSRKLRERGYNQAAVMAIAAGATVETNALERLRDTPSQSGLDKASRRRNVAGAFRARALLVRKRRVLLVDDVLTTGATAEAATQALLSAGAAEVHVLTLARAMT